ncbi:MAG TPA: hypothetical protein VGK74_08925 [Symbiobacteriaceae bacterium]|jgi:hypothetical protein
MGIINPNPEEASVIKRMIGDRAFAVVNLGDRQALIEIVDSHQAQELLDAAHSDPAQAALTRESIRQRKAGEGITLAAVKKTHLNG